MADGKSHRKTPRRILLVDDHPIIRERLVEILEAEPGLKVCGEAEDCAPALDLIRKTRPHLVIADLTLKNSYGLDLIKQIQTRHPGLPTLVLSMHDEQVHAERALRAGARGYVTKQESTTTMLAAVHAVLEGKLYFSDAINSRLTRTVARRPRAKPGLFIDSLTDRELRVFELLGQGYATRQVADQLKLDVRTVETYRARIKEKLHLKNATELLQSAIRWTQTGGLEAEPRLPLPSD